MAEPRPWLVRVLLCACTIILLQVCVCAQINKPITDSTVKSNIVHFKEQFQAHKQFPKFDSLPTRPVDIQRRHGRLPGHYTT